MSDLINCYSTTTKAHETVLFGIGHPLLDMSADVNSNFLEKYQLKKNDMILCPESKSSIYKDLQENFKVTYLPGGASMNAIRAAQWALKNQTEAEGATFCTGTVGDDKNAERMESAAVYAGVRTKYFKVSEAFRKHMDSGNASASEAEAESSLSNSDTELDMDSVNRKSSLPTGTCAVLITEDGFNRSLVTNLAAARIYTTNFLERLWSSHVEKARYFYAPGFFLSTENGQGVAVLKMVGEHCLKENKSFITNISAPFVCNVFQKELAEIIRYADVVFGNDFEYLAWGAANVNLVGEENKDNLMIINKVVANMPKADGGKKPRLAITTRGDKSTLISQGGTVYEIPIHKVPETELVDCNGAGDAFVAGFICGLIYNQSILECIESANLVAGSIIRMPGCTFPQESKLKF